MIEYDTPVDMEEKNEEIPIKMLIENFIKNNGDILIYLLVAILPPVGSVILSFYPIDPKLFKNIIIWGTIGIYALLIYAISKSPRIKDHEFTSIHAANAISQFYRIYFPIILISVAVQFIIYQYFRTGTINQSISPMGNIMFIVPSIVVAIGIMALVDNRMKEEGLSYSLKGAHMGTVRSIAYMMPLIGLYYGLRTGMRFIVTILFGERALITSVQNPFTIDSSLILASRSWIFLSKLEKNMVIIGFVLIYVSMEVLLRGYIGSSARSLNLGIAGMIFVPAIVQAAAFSSGITLFSDPIYYIVTFSDALFLGFVTGIILWKTGRFSMVILMALLTRLMDPSQEFFIAVMKSLPKNFGVYDPMDNVKTFADSLASTIAFIHIVLIILTPLILIVSYNEIYYVTKTLWKGIKKQWFGYIIVTVAFITIDIIFSFVMNISPILSFVGWFVAIIIISVVLPRIYALLPPPKQQFKKITELNFLRNAVPIDVKKDILWLENDKSTWYENPEKSAIITIFAYLYLLFITAAYRQFWILSGIDLVKYIIFLIVMPTLAFSIIIYIIVRAYHYGYYFNENWRSQLFFILILMLIISIVIWAKSTSTTQFVWRNVPLFVLFTIALYPKRREMLVRDYSTGLAGTGRYATFRWIKNYPDEFIQVYNKLFVFNNDNLNSGVYLALSQIGLLEEDNLIEKLNNEKLGDGEIIGIILSLGIIGSAKSESVLLKYIANESLDIKVATYWTLGRIGTQRVLPRMAQVLEDNPIRDLFDIAEEAILKLDPNYPLAGLRDPIILE